MDEDYDISPAKKTLKMLAKLNIPVIPCTSKTASEVRHIRNENSLTDPFIVENGAAVYGCYEQNLSEWELILGKSYSELKTILFNISKKVNYHLTPLNELTSLELSSDKRLLDNITGSYLNTHNINLNPYQVVWLTLDD